MERTLQADLDLLRRAALGAGEIAMTFFRRNPTSWSKEGGSPVCEADMAVDLYLKTTLCAERPHYGWLSEESADDLTRLDCDSAFIVDPIDGTRGFLAGDERWCVSLAIVRSGRPVAAVLYAPALDELYTAIDGRGAWLHDRRLTVSGWPTMRKAKLAGPRGWLKSRRLAGSGVLPQSHVPSLAYRFAEIAGGATDAAFASPNARDWDLAATDLLVHEAGGKLTDLDGATPLYNRETARHGALAAANTVLQPLLVATLIRVAAERAEAGLPV